MKPFLLDLFCGSGGASKGYSEAGFEVFGVDLYDQPHFPFNMIKYEALSYLDFLIERKEKDGSVGIDLIHASPPCQGYTWGTRLGRENRWPLLIAPIREKLDRLGVPYVIENVIGARKDMVNPIMLCGTMFNLKLLRHRLFETSFKLNQPEHLSHTGSVGDGDYVTVAGHGGNNRIGNYRIKSWQEAMGINWVGSRKDLAEMIPPAYTKYIAGQFIGQM